MRLSLIAILGFSATAVHESERFAGDGRGRSSSFTVHSARSLPAASGKKGVFPMNRIGPSGSDLYVANADGTNARRLRGNMSQFDYHVAFSPDAKWTLFTGERNGERTQIYIESAWIGPALKCCDQRRPWKMLSVYLRMEARSHVSLRKMDIKCYCTYIIAVARSNARFDYVRRLVLVSRYSVVVLFCDQKLTSGLRI